MFVGFCCFCIIDSRLRGNDSSERGNDNRERKQPRRLKPTRLFSLFLFKRQREFCVVFGKDYVIGGYFDYGKTCDGCSFVYQRFVYNRVGFGGGKHYAG